MSLMLFNDPLPFLSKIAHITNFRIETNYNPPPVAQYTPPKLHCTLISKAPLQNSPIAPPPIAQCTPSNCRVHALLPGWCKNTTAYCKAKEWLYLHLPTTSHLFGRVAVALWRGNASLWLHRLHHTTLPGRCSLNFLCFYCLFF